MPLIEPSYGNSATRTSLMSYLRYAYVGLKGGVRKRVHHYVNAKGTNSAQVKVTLGAVATAAVTGSSYVTTPPVASVRGTVTFVPQSNGGIEVELPFYSNNLFVKSFSEDLIGDNYNEDMVTKWSKTYITSYDMFDANDAGYVIEETGTGEDFTFLRFQGAPFFSDA